MVAALAFIGAYIVLVGVASFAEQFVSRRLDALHLDALLRLGAIVLALGALLVAHRVHAPGFGAIVFGLGIGLIGGSGSVCYCLALDGLPGYLVACLGNAYLAITILLGIVVLREPLTLQRVLGLLLTGAGVVLLFYHHRHPYDDAKSQRDSPERVPAPLATSGRAKPQAGASRAAMGWIAAYIVLIGVSAFLEKPALAQLDPFQLNALVAVGMLVVGVGVVLIRDPRAIPHMRRERKSSLYAIGLGALIGAGSIAYYLGLARLPVSIASTLSNTYIVVPVVLTAVVTQQTITWPKVGGVAAILAGASLLVLPPL